MARTIESPGVEIKEIDLSLNASLPVGTNVLVQGFAAQGPTDELLNVTSISEFEQIYGMPTNAAERYFYHTAKQVIGSPGNLLCTRFPYGTGDGTGYGATYSALVYPVSGQLVYSQDAYTAATWYASSNGTTTLYNTSAINGYTGVVVSAAAMDVMSAAPFDTSTWDVNATFTYNLSTTNTWSVCGAILANYAVAVSGGEMNYDVQSPTLISLTESEYNNIKNGNINWINSYKPISTAVQEVSAAGMIILNELKTTVDENYAGYYIALADNTKLNDSSFNVVSALNYKDPATGLWTGVPEARLTFGITGANPGSSGTVSEDVEGIPSNGGFGDFDTTTYQDSLIAGLFRIRPSLYGSASQLTLDKVLAESTVGSLDIKRTYTPQQGGTASFFLGNKIASSSVMTKMYVNPNISTNSGNWTDGSTGIPRKTVTINTNAMNAYAIGPVQLSTDTNSKAIGDIPTKLERSLRLAENKEQIPIDIVCDGGVSTIWAAFDTIADQNPNTRYATIYDDTVYLPGVTDSLAGSTTNYLGDQNEGASSTVQNAWETVYNLFEQFVGTTRKDCLFIADALRHIFVQGADNKILNDTTKNFSQHIYWPLKNLFAAANSNYSCTYGNWVKVYDNSLGDYTWLPFSGFEANIMAKLDSNLQPWFAAAGLNNGIVRGIVDISFNPTQKQRDYLYRISVNPLVFFPGDGYTVWGQKTLQKKPSAFDRINVRRLFLVLEKATLAIMRYFVFEPNTIFTRTRVVNVLKPIFEIAKNNEGVYDYLIVCDDRNNTPDVIDRNELVVDIYIKPVRIAEFILVNFIATRTDQNFNELI